MDAAAPPLALATASVDGGPPGPALLVDGVVVDLARAAPAAGDAAPPGLRGDAPVAAAVALGLLRAETLDRLAAALRRRGAIAGAALPGARLLPPLRPGKVIAVGRNYAAHARELGNAVPEAPFFFLKAPSTAVGHGAPVVIPRDVEGEVHHEAELAAVIGRGGRRIEAARAADHVAAFLCANDVTARTEQKALQERKLPWCGGKNADTFLVLGPGLVPADAVRDPGHLRVRCLVDGAVRQDGATSDMIRPLAELVAWASRRMTLEPGDVILTGTPPGVGPLLPGNVVEVRIDGVGSLANPVVLEGTAGPREGAEAGRTPPSPRGDGRC